MKLTDVLVGIDKSEEAALKGEPMVKEVQYTLDELAVHEFWESMARTYCILDDKNPDEMIDTMPDKVPGLLGVPTIARTPRWRSIVRECIEVNKYQEAWLATRDDRIARINAKVQAMAQAEKEAAQLKPEEKH